MTAQQDLADQMTKSGLLCTTRARPLLLSQILMVVAFLHGAIGSMEVNQDGLFQGIMDAFYDFRSREFPEFATLAGYHRYNDKLESFTLESFERRKNETETFLGELQALDRGQMSKVNQREHRILTSHLQTFLNGYRWLDYGPLNSINFLEGLSQRHAWAAYQPLEMEQDFKNYLIRLRKIPNQVQEQMAQMRRAIQLNRTSHLVSVSRVPKYMEEWDVDGVFLLPFQRSLIRRNFAQTVKLSLWETANQLMSGVKNAFSNLKTFLAKEYLPSTRQEPGVQSLPQGRDYYLACLSWYLGQSFSAEQIMELGTQEVARINGEIQQVMSSVNFSGDLISFFNQVKNIPEFYNHTKYQLLLKYRSLLEVDIIPRLDQMFYNLTIEPIVIVPVQREGPWGSYGLGTFYVNLLESTQRSTFTMTPLTLHEAYPGHHFQDLYTKHFKLPAYRAHLLNGRLYSVPFNFPVYSAYAEGWAVYAEYLGHELGLYQNPYLLFGRYLSEIFRACRLVMDAGIHAFGWSRERAIQYLQGYSDFPYSQVVAEVDRYVTVPGQACAYKVGEIRIRSIREKAEKALGDLFDLREFHHRILSLGFVPLDILEEVVEEWVQEKLASSSSQLSGNLIDQSTTHNLAELGLRVSTPVLLSSLLLVRARVWF